ncbi:unnamed protein product [Dovyalis caffra]|uniref:Uncharacterized protein n=1 Tax=Dovyalis caffra TaxID=77055 RepID=A0AAV1SGR4_9ROSI|nr:unnamed protein product [Dovyalis caffra]
MVGTSGNSIGLAILTETRALLQVVKSTHLVKGKKKESEEPKKERSRSRGSSGNFILMMELRKKIITFRDIIDLPPFDGSLSINELDYEKHALTLKTNLFVAAGDGDNERSAQILP